MKKMKPIFEDIPAECVIVRVLGLKFRIGDPKLED